ncbi:MAG TPA: RNA-binding domain-containing protein [Candidatus Bathyarchaeia archaeon]|nr:RNA-binding domain-containing protein [Candidatus Bathyarchaeia archaeon]
MQKLPISSLVELKVEARVNPSESPERVKTAVANVIQCTPEFRYGNKVIGKSFGGESLRTIYEQIRSRTAMGVLRRILLINRVDNSTWFLLNKQAAATGIIVVVDDERESPLGSVRVTISCEEMDALIDWLVPSNTR